MTTVSEASRIETEPKPSSVFVVHGRNEKATNAIFDFLRAAGLEILTWEASVNKAIEKTKNATPFIGDILEAGLSSADAVLVLLTGDDMARIVNCYGTEPLTAQPRANVI